MLSRGFLSGLTRRPQTPKMRGSQGIALGNSLYGYVAQLVRAQHS